MQEPTVRTISRWIFVIALLFWLSVGQAELAKVRVVPGDRVFTTADGRRYVPFGVNYFRPGTGWAPQVWRQFDPEATRQDFARMKALGVNCVRVFLTYGSFMMEPGIVLEEGLRKLDRFLDLAEAQGIYVHPTGPDHWEGLPDWARGDRIAEETVLSALEQFWRTVATRYRGRSAIFAYDLLNEPEVGWDSPAMRTQWNRWLAERYRDLDTLNGSWGREAEGAWGAIAVPSHEDAPGDRALLDYQRFRESLADEWTRRQVAAIRAADGGALVTVGLIQWSIPAVLASPRHYSGFRPGRQAPFLDFLEVHFYPLAQGAYHYDGAEAEACNLAYLESVVAETARPGKPVVLAEFGWYGGGQPRYVGAGARLATEDQQAAWGRAVVESTAGLAAGWLHWGFYDQPEARDVTELIGLTKPDGTLKAWGHAFRELSGRLAELAEPRDLGARPALDWDACVTGAAARQAHLQAYLQAWLDARTRTRRE